MALEALKAQAKVAESLGNSENTMIIPAETAGLFGAIGSIQKVLAKTNNAKTALGSASDETGRESKKQAD